MQHMRDETQQMRIDGQKREVASRLRNVCRDMPEAEFDELVSQIVAVNIKYVNLRSDFMFRTPPRPGPAEPGKP
jgi:hypothetical protein